MQKKTRKKIDDKLRVEIMNKLFEPVCKVPELSKIYGLSPHTLRKWRYNIRKGPQEQAKEKVGANFTSQSCNFVELSVLDSKRKLNKASLVFEDVAVSLEGKISSSDLMSIIKILDASC